MMRKRTAVQSPPPEKEKDCAGAPASWEVRPGGMLVQKRSSGGKSHPAALNIRVRVKHGEVYHEIYLSSQSSFGELKKLVAERTGMHPLDQKVLYKNRERDSAAFLDTSGVKDGAKMMLEDPAAQVRRFLEMRQNAKLERASKSISEISLEVDKLASKVSVMESIVAKGGKMAEIEVASMIEMFMKQLVKLDGIVADGDVKAQRRIQVRRVQKNIEALDALKVKNVAAAPPPPPPKGNERQPPPSPPTESVVNGHAAAQGERGQLGVAPPLVETTEWEVFDSLFSSKTLAGSSNTATTTSGSSPAAKLEWELF